MIGGHSGRGRWRGQEGRAFQRRETGKKEADVHGMEKSAKGKPVAMVQGNRQGSSRERWCEKPCRAGGSGGTKKRQGAAQCDCTGKAVGGRLGAAAQGNWQEGGRGMRHWETNGRALESSGARKPTERCPGGVAQKNRQAGGESDSAGKPREENREKRHGKGNRNTAEGGWRGNPREQTARKRDRPKKPGGKESGRLPHSATARSSPYLAGPDGPLPVPTGRSTVKAMRPPPLSARISPPWRCTMSRAMASPSPAPPVAVCREASSR